MIRIPGYTLEEKVSIAEAYLIPKQMAQNGIGTEHLLLPRSTVLRVASSYTREAGVRQLERELAAVCRHVALKVRWLAGCRFSVVVVGLQANGRGGRMFYVVRVFFCVWRVLASLFVRSCVRSLVRSFVLFVFFSRVILVCLLG